MKFRFSLEAVLKQRKAVESLAQKDFSMALSLLNEQVSILGNLRAARSQAFSHIYDLQNSGGAQGQSLDQASQFISGQDVRIARQEQLIEKLKAKVEEMREILRHKAIDSKIIEVAKEKAFQEFKLEIRKKEQKTTDEMNSLRAMRRKGDSDR